MIAEAAAVHLHLTDGRRPAKEALKFNFGAPHQLPSQRQTKPSEQRLRSESAGAPPQQLRFIYIKHCGPARPTQKGEEKKHEMNEEMEKTEGALEKKNLERRKQQTITTTTRARSNSSSAPR